MKDFINLKAKYYLLVIVIISCFNCIGQNAIHEDFKGIDFCKMKIEKEFIVSFRDSVGKIDWNYLDSNKKIVLSDSIKDKYFKDIDELNKWNGYQECTIDGYKQIDDSISLFILTNKILNGNEANKYLISLNTADCTNSNTFLLAKVEKSQDDLYEIYSKIISDTVYQVHIYKFIEENSIITDSVFYKYETNKFMNYYLIDKNSIRIKELIPE